MLLLTGKFKGKEYNEQPISAVELAEEFGLPKAPAEGESLELRLVESKIKTVKGTGERLAPKSLMPVAKLNGTFNDGSTFILRYVRNVVNLANGQKNFLPNNVSWSGRVAMFGVKDYEKFVFLALHSRCATSPFAGPLPWFELVDPAKEAAKAQAVADMSIQIMNIIWNTAVTPDDVMRLKAAGLVIKGKSPEITAKMPIASVRNAVFAIAQEYPREFLEQWSSVTTILNSLLLEARDKNILSFKANAGNGRSGWVWTKGERADAVACYTTSTEEPFRALQSHAAANYDTFMGLLTQVLGEGVATVVQHESGVDITPAQSTPNQPVATGSEGAEQRSVTVPDEPKTPANMSWQEKVIHAVENNMIAFDVSNGDVRWKNEDLMFELKPILTGQSVETWLNATINFFGQNTSMYHRRVMNSKLGLGKEA